MEDLPEFQDIYEFLGIIPGAPPEFINLAVDKIERYIKNFNESPVQLKETCLEELQKGVNLAKNVLNDELYRFDYDRQWRRYYFPENVDGDTNVYLSQTRTSSSTIHLAGYRAKADGLKPNIKKKWLGDGFNYKKDFCYILVVDNEDLTDIRVLDPGNRACLPEWRDILEFQGKQFNLHTSGENWIKIYNDALGKKISVRDKSQDIPIHIGDRIRVNDEEKFILRGFYTKTIADSSDKNEIPVLVKLFRPSTISHKTLSIYWPEEDKLFTLDPAKITVVGRHTSQLTPFFPSDMYFFINIGHSDLTISRQNFQIFNHRGNFYIQDLGSRFGTTLDFHQHFKLETLVAGAIMGLEPGLIRIGKKKEKLFYIGNPEEMEAKRSSLAITRVQMAPGNP